MQPLKREIAGRAVSVAGRIGSEALPEIRRRIDRWRDPRARLLRKRRRARRATMGGAVATGVFGASSVGSITVDLAPEVLQYSGAAGFGGLAALSCAAAVGTGVRYRRLNRQPLPEPVAQRVVLPPTGSAAHMPMKRLGDAERSLYRTTTELYDAQRSGDGVAVTEARATADAAATELRRGADRLVAVEASMEHVPPDEHAELATDVERMRAELDRGVTEYGRLVAAAGRALAARDEPEQHTMLRDATDRLNGLAEGRRAVFGSSAMSGPVDSRGAASADEPTTERERSAARVHEDERGGRGERRE